MESEYGGNSDCAKEQHVRRARKTLPELMLPNDARWKLFPAFVVFRENCDREVDFCSVEDFQNITDAAAVAACWWHNEDNRRFRIYNNRTEDAKNADSMRYSSNQFDAWLALTTADSLNGYTFTAWKEIG